MLRTLALCCALYIGLPVLRAVAADYDVIVVGAGAAGIAAARKLTEAGKHVIVLEARNRPGGRVWTESWEDLNGQDVPVELGAQWLHGVDSNVLWPLAQKGGVSVAMTDWDDLVVYGLDNKTLPASKLTALEQLLDVVEEHMADWQGELGDEDEPLASVLDHAREQYKEDLEGLSTQEVDWVFNTEIEQEYAADLANLSAKWYDAAEEQEGEDAFMGVVGGGFQQFLHELAEGLDIQYNSTVTAIDYSSGNGPVAVSVSRSGPTLTADAVLVTLPLGVLQDHESVSFEPQLPQAKRDAIGALAMGLLNKVVLAFEEEAFWDDVQAIHRVTSPPGTWAEFVAVGAYSNASLLAAFNAGKTAARVEQLTDEQAVSEAMDVLRELYGDAVPAQPSEYWVTRWGEDPHSRGSYSYVPVGATPDAREALGADIEDKLFFAGEATSTTYPSTVNGAWETGEARARDILKALGSSTRR